MEDAILSNDISLLKFYLDQGSNPNEKNKDGTPYLFLTTNLEVIEVLLTYGANPKTIDEYGFTIEDYIDDDEIITLINKPRNTIEFTPTKTIKYNNTLKLKKKYRSKTRRANLS
jgi:ankyrin repeat protein